MLSNLIIIFILLLISFLVILFINNKLESKVIKYSILVYSLIYFILIILFDNDYIYLFLKSLITYIWYPSYLLFVLNSLISIFLFIYSILNKKISFLNKFVNYIYFGIVFSCYNIFRGLEIDPLIYSELYSRNSLLLMRISSIITILTILLNIIFKMRGNDEK